MAVVKYILLKIIFKQKIGLGILGSFFLHLLLILIIVYSNFFLTKGKINFSSVYNVELVSTTDLIPTDPIICSTSSLTSKFNSELEQESILINTPKKSEPSKLKVSKDAKLDINKELVKSLQNLKTKVEEQRHYKQILNQFAKKTTLNYTKTNNFLSPNIVKTGENSNFFSDQTYLTELWERIQNKWILPDGLVQKFKGLVAIVMLRIRRDGILDKFWLEYSSGNQHYDELALKATERAAPFSPLLFFVGEYYEVGVRFRLDNIIG